MLRWYIHMEKLHVKKWMDGKTALYRTKCGWKRKERSIPAHIPQQQQKATDANVEKP